MAQLAGKKLELEENKGLVEEYLERYYEELKEKDKQKQGDGDDDDDDDNDDRDTKRIRTLSISLKPS